MYATRDENGVAQIKLQAPEEAYLVDEVIERHEKDAAAHARATVREWHPRCSREYGKPWCGHYEERENPSKPSKRQEWCHALCAEIPNDRYYSDHTELEDTNG